MDARAVIKDPRFSALHNDPRFARKRASKPKLSDARDARFAALETDKDFSVVGDAPTDKYGRRKVEEEEEE